MKSFPRIVVTGLGAVCGAGLAIEEIWNAIQTGKTAIAPLKQWDASRWPVRQAAEVTDVSDTTLSLAPICLDFTLRKRRSSNPACFRIVSSWIPLM
jgi:3-oxoacyl-(acyl-carrier-protein) synthase